MKLACAPSVKRIKSLIQYIQKGIDEKGKDINLNRTMQFIFDGRKAAQDKANENLPDSQKLDSTIVAAELVKHVPFIVVNDLMRRNIQTNKIQDFYNAHILFNNPETGLENIIKQFTIDVNRAQAAVQTSNKAANTESQNSTDQANEKVDVTPPVRLKTFSPLTGTITPFVKINPNNNQVTIEKEDKNKTTIINTLNALSLENQKGNGLYDFIYQGTRLKLKAVNLNKFNNQKDFVADKKYLDELDSTTRQEVLRSRKLVGSKKNVEGVLQENDRAILVVTDQYGYPIRFSEEGNISRDGTGQIVYQFLRSVKNGKVTDIYGREEQIADPLIVSESLGITFEEAKKRIDEEISVLEKLNERVVKNKEDVILDITGLTEGVSSTLSGKKIKINSLEVLPGMTEAKAKGIVKSIEISPNDAIGIKSGFPFVMINGNPYAVDRPTIEKELATEIAEVLTKDIPTSERVDFIDQFLPIASANEYAKGRRSYKLNASDNGSLYFELRNGQVINLSPNKLSDITQQDKDTIVEALTTGWENRGVGSPMNYNKKLLSENSYDRYDIKTGKFKRDQDYIEFLGSQNADITLSDLDAGFYNQLIQFGNPDSQISKDVNKANQKRDTRSTRKRTKDNLVEFFQNNEDTKTIPVKVSSLTQAMARQDQRMALENPLTGPMLSTVVRDVNTLVGVETGDTVELKIVTEEDPDFYPDTIGVYFKGNKIAVIAETDFDNAAEKEAYLKNQKEEEKIITKNLNNEYISNTLLSKTSSSNTNAANTFKSGKHFRRGYSLSKVTQQQINDAKKWWANSPLNKYIELDPLINAVNSDQFASFVINAAALVDPNAPLAKVGITAKGTEVDLYHEAWHGFTQLYLTQKQKDELYAEVKKLPKYKNKSSFEIEEALAEDFRNYAKNPKIKKGRPKRNTIFRKILNFINKLLNKLPGIKINNTDANIDVLSIPSVKELYDNLYLASSDPKYAEQIMNNYTPLVQNTYWYELNRGIRRTDNAKFDALNDFDSNKIVNIIDSVISDISNEINYDRLTTNSANPKAGTLGVILNKSARKETYDIVLERFENKLKDYYKELDKISKMPSFNDIKTLSDIKKNAAGVLKGAEGVNDKYIFTRAQVNSFENLNADIEKGERILGSNFRGVDIISDYYTHTDAKIKNRPVEIIVVNKIEDAERQLYNYKRVGDESYVGVTDIKPVPTTQLTSEQSKILDNIRMFQAAIANWGDENSGVIKYHRNKSRYSMINKAYDLTNTALIEEQQEIDEILNPEEKDSSIVPDKSIGKKSLLQLAEKEASYIIGSLHKVDINGNAVFNEQGFRELADFNESFNVIANLIQGVKDPAKAYNILKEASKDFPVLKELIQLKLTDPSLPINHEYDFDIVSAFFHTFKKPKIDYLQLTAFEEDGKYNLAVTQSDLDVDGILREYREGFNAQPEGKYVSKTIDNQSVLKLQDVVKDFTDSKGRLKKDKSVEFLNALGIDVDNIKRIREAFDKDAVQFYGLNYIHAITKGFAEIQQADPNDPSVSVLQKQYAEEFVKSPAKVLAKKIPAKIITNPLFKGKPINQYTQVKRIANLQAKYGAITKNTGILDAKGNLIFNVIQDSSATYLVDDVNSMDNLSNAWLNRQKSNTPNEFAYLSKFNPEKNTFTKESILLNSVFRIKDGGNYNKRKDDIVLDLFATSGVNVSDSAKASNNTTSLYRNDKFSQEFHTFLLDGVKEFIRHGEKKSAFGLRVLDSGSNTGSIVRPQRPDGKEYDKSLYVDVDMFTPEGGGSDYAINNMILPYLRSEFTRIKRFGENRAAYSQLTSYNKELFNGRKAGESFTMFDGMLRDTTKNELYALPISSSVDVIDYLTNNKPELKEKVVKEIKEYFEEEVSKTKEYAFDNSNYVDDALIKKLNLPELVTEGKTENEIELLKAERKTLEVNSLLKAYEYNSFIHNFETINLIYGDPLQFNYVKEDITKRIGASVGGGNNMILAQNAINWINKQWVGNRDTYASINKKPELTYGQTFNTDVIEDSIKDSLYLPIIEKAAKEKFAKEFPKGTKKELDAFVKSITDGYKDMEESDGGGYISFDAYRMFKKASNKWSENQEDLYQKLIKGEKVDAEDVVDFFPIYKLAYYGDIANAPVTATAMHKFALTPLIPGIISPVLTDLHNAMMDEGLHYVTYGTGSKITALTREPGKLTDIFTDKTSSQIKEITEEDRQKGKKLFYPNVLYTKGLKEVTDVNTSYKSSVTFPTQQRPVLLDALVSVGELLNEDNKPLLDEYYKQIRDYTKANQLELLNDIGFEIDKNGRFIPIDGNLSKLMSVIKKELEKNEVPKTLRDLVDVTRTTKSRKVDLSIYPRPDDIEKLLMTLVQKRLVRYKVNGEALVQGPVTMWKDLWATQEVIKDKSKQRELLGTNGLVFYTPGNAAHTAITMQGPFVNLLNLEDPDSPGLTIKDTGDVDRLNELIKDPKFREENREALTILGPRIPIDSANSIEIFEVWHFLKPGGGNQIIVPTEIVAKAGSDFDVDKLNMMFPHIGKDGKILKTKFSEKDLISEIERGDKQNTVLVEDYKKAKFNELLKVMKDILLLPENYINLIKPNETTLVENQVDYLQTATGGYSRFENLYTKDEGRRSIKGKKAVSPTTTLSTSYILEKHDANLTGAGPLGVIALVNKMHSLYKSVNFMMPQTYIVSNKSRMIHRLLFDHNKTGKNISLAHEYNKDNARISDVISHLLNALLDRGKLQYPVDLKATPEGINMVSYLVQAGVKQDEVFLYMNQPLIVEYLNEQARLKGAFAKITGEDTNKVQQKAAENVLNSHFNEEQLSNIIANANNSRNGSRLDKKRPLPKINTILEKNLPYSSLYMTNKYLKNGINKDVLKKQIEDTTLITSPTDLALFLSYLETEKAIKGLRTLQPISTPDTNYTKTLQELDEAKQARSRLTGEGLDLTSVNRLLDGSILTPFKIGKLADSIISQAMPLRSSQWVRDFISDQLKDFDSRNEIKARFGSDAGYVSRFSSSFNNAIINSLFQNKLSRFVDGNNKVLLYPESYKGNKVEFVDGNPNFVNADPVTVYEGKIYINKGKLTKQFRNQVFLNTNNTEEGHLKRGLDTFAPQENPFPAFEDYIRYMMDVEYMKEYQYTPNSLSQDKDFRNLVSKTKDLDKAFTSYVSQKALSNTFNRAYILGITKYSYFDQVNNIINEFPNLKEDYPVLAQLAKAKLKADRKEKIFSLNNKMLVKGSLAEDYDVQLRKLANIGVMKSLNAQDNQRITDVFKKFSLMSEYQTGTGFHPNSLMDILNPSQKVALLRGPVNKAVNTNLNNIDLLKIYSSLINAYQFQNYLMSSSKTQDESGIVDLDAEDMLQYFPDGKEVDIEEVFPETVEEETAGVKPENISSKGSSFAKKLTNPGNNLEVTYKGRKFRNAEHAYQTYKSGEFDQKAYNSTAFKPIGSKPANKNTNYQTMVDILKAKLEQHPELIEGINQRGGLAYIEQSTHNVTGDKFWESKGQNKFIEALADAYNSTQPAAGVAIYEPVNITFPKNAFTIKPIKGRPDKKATAKSKIATQFIGFAEGIAGSSTANYAQQAGLFANTGNYGSDDVIFVSIGGKRGSAQLQKSQQDRTIREAIKAVEAGATILTDNKAYTDTSTYNTGEKRLYENMEAKGYNYSEVTVDGETIGTWSKTVQPTGEVTEIEGLGKVYSDNEVLSKIGTEDQYQRYINSKFPTSRMKNVVYRGTPSQIIKSEYDRTPAANLGRGIYYAGDIRKARKYGDNISTAIVNIEDPLIVSINMNDNRGYSSNLSKINAKQITVNKDNLNGKTSILSYEGFQKEDYVRYNDYTGHYIGPLTEEGLPAVKFRGQRLTLDEVVLTSPEQVYELGTKEDIQGFKEFVRDDWNGPYPKGPVKCV